MSKELESWKEVLDLDIECLIGDLRDVKTSLCYLQSFIQKVDRGSFESGLELVRRSNACLSDFLEATESMRRVRNTVCGLDGLLADPFKLVEVAPGD